MTASAPSLTGRMHSNGRWVTAAVAALVVVPLALLVVQALADRWTGRAIWPQALGGRAIDAVLHDPLLPAAARNSVIVGLLTVTVALVLGWPAARAVADSTGRTRTVVVVVIVAPLVVPQVAVGSGLTTWWLRLGLADSLVGVALAHLVYVLGYVVLALIPAFSPELTRNEEAATLLGASQVQRFRTVTLPASRGPVLLAVALGFAVSWSQYGTSLGVGGGIPLLPLVAVPYLRSDPQIGAAVTVLLLLPTLILTGLAGRQISADTDRISRGSR
jgi:putative spermidine/putrescine transport system permease protein